MGGSEQAVRLDKARKTMSEAEGIARLEYWSAVANRLYYATSALLIANKFNAQTHRGVVHLLGMHFIREEIISKESGKFYSRLFELRQTGDYDDLFELTEEDVKPLLKPARDYIDEIEELIKI